MIYIKYIYQGRLIFLSYYVIKQIMNDNVVKIHVPSLFVVLEADASGQGKTLEKAKMET